VTESWLGCDSREIKKGQWQWQWQSHVMLKSKRAANFRVPKTPYFRFPCQVRSVQIVLIVLCVILKSYILLPSKKAGISTSKHVASEILC